MSHATLNVHVERIRAALVHIQRHLDADLPLAELARVAHYSPFHFHRVFRGLVGETVAELTRRLRMERAAAQLVHSESPIVQIALAAGYESHEAFTRAFASQYRRSPSDFRKARDHAGPLPAPSHVHYTGDDSFRFVPIFEQENAMEFRIEVFPTTRFAHVRGTGPYHLVLGPNFRRLHELAGKRGLHKPGAMIVAVCYDDPETTPPDQIRSDAAVSVDSAYAGDSELPVMELHGGRYAITTYLGPYSGLGQAWQTFVGQLLPQSGLQMRAGACFEHYVNDCSKVAPEEVRTDLYVPIA